MKLDETKAQMDKTIEATKRSFNSVRTGRANAALLDRVSVEYYGAETPIKSLANISTPDASTIAIQPFDMGSLGDIERAIALSDIGLTPSNDGKIIRLNIPALTKERRKELVKTVAKLAEEGKVALRNIRRDAMDKAKKEEKNGDISKDDLRDIQDDIQGLTDSYSKKIDELLKIKEEEITTI